MFVFRSSDQDDRSNGFFARSQDDMACVDSSASGSQDDVGMDYETNEKCYICNGYYGPSFEEPVCSTCHIFLFPEEWSCTNPQPVFTEKTDDGDSGNDEPTDPYCVQSSNQSPAPALTQVVQLASPNTNDVKVNSPVVGPADDCSVRLLLSLPPEVLLTIFSYLDDMSLWSASNTCRRWMILLQSHLSDDMWKKYTHQRFPIFKPLYQVDSWCSVYAALMDSCPCKACLVQMSLQTSPPGEENSWRRNRLRSELKSLKSDPPQGIFALPLDGKYCHWQASITGPVESPYEGGIFYLYLQVPYSYPMQPPTVRFLTKIFHPNVSRHGDVGLDSIHHNWSLALTISKILISVQSLLTDPYCEVCMEPEVGKLYTNDEKAFKNIARSWTWKYAMRDLLSPIVSPSYHDPLSIL